MNSLGHGSAAHDDKGGRTAALTWCSRDHLEAVRACVAEVWAEWASGWLPERPWSSGQTKCSLAHEGSVAATVWVSIGARGKAAAWIGVRHENPVADVKESMFGFDRGGAADAAAVQDGIAWAVASQGWTALKTSLREALALDADPAQAEPDGATFKPWSGAALVSIAGSGSSKYSLLLSAQCVRALLVSRGIDLSVPPRRNQPRKGLIALGLALADRRIAVRVELAPCELDLGSLEGLRIGDIVPLPHDLDAPLRVSTGHGPAICGGFLGRQAGHKAVELARDTALVGGPAHSNHPL